MLAAHLCLALLVAAVRHRPNTMVFWSTSMVTSVITQCKAPILSLVCRLAQRRDSCQEALDKALLYATRPHDRQHTYVPFRATRHSRYTYVAAGINRLAVALPGGH
jgi:hypothetical protein